MKIGTYSFRLFLSLVLVLFLGACSKKQAKPSVTMQFSSKVSSASARTIDGVLVNVSSAGVLLDAFELDCELEDCNNISFDVDSPGSKLIQVLILTEDSSNVTYINYGDVAANLTGGDNFFTISLRELGNFRNEADVMGRYIPSAGPMAGKVLTGQIITNVAVEVGKPDMKVSKTEMFGGMFRLFALDSVGFKYTFTGFDRNGNFYFQRPIFNDLHDVNGLTLSSLGIRPASPRVAHFDLGQQHYEINQDDDPFELESFDRQIMGFFGLSTAGDVLCADQLSPATLLDGQNGKGFYCKTIDPISGSCSTYFNWGEMLTNSSATGVDGASSTCTSSPSELKVDLARIGDHGTEIMGFFGPFETTAAGTLSDLTSSGVLSWRINSGTYLDEDSAVEVFVSSDVSNFYQGEVETDRDGIDCEALVAYGFESIGTFPLNSGADSSATIPAALQGANTGYAICPLHPDGGYYDSALVFDGNQNDGPAFPTQVKLLKAPHLGTSVSTVNQSVCYPFLVQLVDDAGNLASSPSTEQINLSSNNAGNKFFTSRSDCQAGTPDTSVVMTHNQQVIYFKATATNGTYTLSADDDLAVLGSTSLTITVQAPGAINIIEMVPSYYRANEMEVASTEICVPFKIVGKDSDGELVPFGSGPPMFNLNGVRLSDNTTPALFYATKATCELGSAALSTNQTLPSADVEYEVWLAVPSSPDTIGGILATTSTDCVSINCAPGGQTISVVSPGPFNHFHADLVEGDMTAGSCNKFKLGAYDNHKPNSYPAAFPSSGSVFVDNQSTDGGLFYDALNPCDNNIIFLDVDSGYHSLVGVSGSQTEAFVQYQPNEVLGGTEVNLTFEYAGYFSSFYQSLSAPSDAFLSISHGPIYDFGLVTGGTEPTHIFTVTNEGSVDAATLSASPITFTFNSSEYSIVVGAGTTCTASQTLAAGASCTIEIEMENPGSGFSEAIMNVHYADSVPVSRQSKRVLRGQRP